MTRPNRPGFFAASTNRFAARPLSNSETCSIIIHCLPLGCPFATSSLSQFCTSFLASSTVGTWWSVTPPHPLWRLSLPRSRLLRLYLIVNILHRVLFVLHLTIMDYSYDLFNGTVGERSPKFRTIFVTAMTVAHPPPNK